MDVDREHVVAMAEAARLAPSVLNTQPWRFHSRPDGLTVSVDDRRGLPVLDPTGRLRTISCGAAVANAALASVARGYGTRVHLLPDGPRGGTVARLVAVAPRVPTTREQRLARAVPLRRSHRALHPHDPVPDALLADLADTVADEGASLTALTPTTRAVLARLLLRAVREQEHRPDLITETRSWLRPTPVRGRPLPVDGVLGNQLDPVPLGPGVGTTGASPGWSSSLGAPVRQRGHVPSVTGTAALEEVTGSTVVVLSTLTDTRRDHLVAGIALQRLLLHLTALDLVACWADHATEVADTRDQVSALLARPGQAQVVLRVGRAAVDVRRSPRRPLSDLLDPVDAGTRDPAQHRPAVVDLTRTEERTHR